MADFRSPFIAYIVGPPEFERFVIKRNFFVPPDYFTGSTEDVWTQDLHNARKYANLGDLSHDLHELAIRELDHLPQARYRQEVEITAIGDSTPEQVREYLFDALMTGLDYENHGPGAPSSGSGSASRGIVAMSRPCRACGSPLGYRTAATDLRHLDDQLTLCRHCFNEMHRGILLVWTDCPHSPCGTGTVPRQQENRRKTDC